MKVFSLTSETHGGAGVSALRLHQGLLNAEQNSELIFGSGSTPLACSQKFQPTGLLIAGVSYLFGRYTHNPVNIFLAAFVYYIPCFFLGYLIKTSHRKIPSWFLGFGIAMGFLATAVGFYKATKAFGIEKGEYFYGYMSFNVVFISCLLLFLFKEIRFSFLSQPLRLFSCSVLGVYLVHPIFLDLLCAWGYGPVARNRIFSIPLVCLAVLFLSFVSVFLVSRVPYLRRVV